MSSNCQLNIRIEDFQPVDKLKVEPSKFLFRVKTEGGEGEINYMDKDNSSLLSTVNCSHNGEIRINFRLYNSESNTLLGLADLLIPFPLIKNYTTGQSFTYSKQIILQIIDSSKRQLFGSLLQSKPLIVSTKVDIEVLQNKNAKLLNKNLLCSSSIGGKSTLIISSKCFNLSLNLTLRFVASSLSSFPSTFDLIINCVFNSFSSLGAASSFGFIYIE